MHVYDWKDDIYLWELMILYLNIDSVNRDSVIK